MTQSELGERLRVATRTVARWEREETEGPPYLKAALRELLTVPDPVKDDPAGFTFIDLFAGIGGMRRGFESAGSLLRVHE